MEKEMLEKANRINLKIIRCDNKITDLDSLKIDTIEELRSHDDKEVYLRIIVGDRSIGSTCFPLDLFIKMLNEYREMLLVLKEKAEKELEEL